MQVLCGRVVPGSDQSGYEDKCGRSWATGLCSQALGWDLAEVMARFFEVVGCCKDGGCFGDGPGAGG